MAKAPIGIIGSSGLYKMDALQNIREVNLQTPFGDPSDTITLGTLNNIPVAFLPRHGRNHTLLPSELPFRANIHAMKQLEVEYIISASAVGSLHTGVKPLDMVVPDQFIDRTKNRASTFFGDGIVAHIAFGDPICPNETHFVRAFTNHCNQVFFQILHPKNVTSKLELTKFGILELFI